MQHTGKSAGTKRALKGPAKVKSCRLSMDYWGGVVAKELEGKK